MTLHDLTITCQTLFPHTHCALHWKDFISLQPDGKSWVDSRCCSIDIFWGAKSPFKGFEDLHLETYSIPEMHDLLKEVYAQCVQCKNQGTIPETFYSRKL
jgi:hypothetical protein